MDKEEILLNEEEILLELQKIIKDEFNLSDNKDFVNSVLITSDFGTGFIKAAMLPCIAIMTTDLIPVYGPIANINTLNLGIKIRIITQSSDPNKYITKARNNIYQLTRIIRELIAKNKKLNNKVFGLSSIPKVKKIIVMPIKSAGFFSGCDISYGYQILEAWTGSRNNQLSTKVPTGIKF